MSNPQFPRPMIRASDVGRYAYCARAWWLSTVKGIPTEPTRLAAGTEAHLRHHRRVHLVLWQRYAGLALFLLAALLALYMLLR